MQTAAQSKRGHKQHFTRYKKIRQGVVSRRSTTLSKSVFPIQQIEVEPAYAAHQSIGHYRTSQRYIDPDTQGQETCLWVHRYLYLLIMVPPDLWVGPMMLGVGFVVGVMKCLDNPPSATRFVPEQQKTQQPFVEKAAESSALEVEESVLEGIRRAHRAHGRFVLSS